MIRLYVSTFKDSAIGQAGAHSVDVPVVDITPLVHRQIIAPAMERVSRLAQRLDALLDAFEHHIHTASGETPRNLGDALQRARGDVVPEAPPAPQTAATGSASEAQYFYKDDRCPAATAAEPGCICWHRQGTGPYPGRTPSDKGFPELNWRRTDGDGVAQPVGSGDYQIALPQAVGAYQTGLRVEQAVCGEDVAWPTCEACGFPLGSNVCPVCLASPCCDAWRSSGAEIARLRTALSAVHAALGVPSQHVGDPDVDAAAEITSLRADLERGQMLIGGAVASGALDKETAGSLCDRVTQTIDGLRAELEQARRERDETNARCDSLIGKDGRNYCTKIERERDAAIARAEKAEREPALLDSLTRAISRIPADVDGRRANLIAASVRAEKAELERDDYHKKACDLADWRDRLKDENGKLVDLLKRLRANHPDSERSVSQMAPGAETKALWAEVDAVLAEWRKIDATEWQKATGE